MPIYTFDVDIDHTINASGKKKGFIRMDFEARIAINAGSRTDARSMLDTAVDRIMRRCPLYNERPKLVDKWMNNMRVRLKSIKRQGGQEVHVKKIRWQNKSGGKWITNNLWDDLK